MARNTSNDELVQRKQRRWAAGDKKRVALLLRVSDKKQAKDDQDVPIPVQRDYCLRLFESHSHEWVIATQDVGGRPETIEYTEAGVSAFKLSKDDRELLATAMLDAAADKFDILVIYKTDRLSRNSEEYPIIIRQFANLGVEIWVYETGQPLKSSTQVDKLLRFVEGWQAETESVNTRVRVTNAMRRMAENGLWTGGKTSYGYKLRPIPDQAGTGTSKKRLVRSIEVNEDEAKWVRLMFDLYVNQGLGCSQVARFINNPPYLARKRNGEPWDGPQIIEVLKNPIYMGRPAWGKSSYMTGRRVRKGPKDWVWSEVHVPQWQLVEEATWHKAQELRKERYGEVMKGKQKMPPRSFTSHLLLTGVAFCGYCHQPLVTKTYSNKRVKADGTVVRDKYEGYICRNHKRGAQSSCAGTKGYWRKDAVEDAVLRTVEQWFGQFDFEQVRAKVLEAYRDSVDQAEDGLKTVNEEVEGLQARRRYYADQLNLTIVGKQSRIPLSVIEEQLSEIEAHLSKAQGQLGDLEKQRSARAVEDETLQELARILPKWTEAFKKAPPHMRKFLFNQVVNRVTVYDDTMEVAINVKIKGLVESATTAETQMASGFDGSIASGALSVHQRSHRGPPDL